LLHDDDGKDIFVWQSITYRVFHIVLRFQIAL